MVEGVEDRGLLVMIVNFRPIMFNDLNLVAAVPLLGTGMEVARILIPLQCRSDFASLFP